MELSTEAKVVLTSFNVGLTSMSFDRPHAIHPLARKGLDDLVAAGYLTEAPRNNIKGCPIDFKATPKVRAEPVRVTLEFARDNSFPFTVD